MTNCDEYDKAAATLHATPSPASATDFGGLTSAQALQLCVLEGRLHRRDILLFRRLARMLTPKKPELMYVCVYLCDR